MWDDLEITNRINEVRHAMVLDRMPSRAEVEAYYGNTGLVNAIAKHGGFYHWAKKLELKVKECETQLGYECEMLVKGLLEEQGYVCEKTSARHPYDLLVNGCVKIDVKVARISRNHNTDYYSFSLAKPMQTCDVYVAVCLDDNDEVKKLYVIPAHIMTGKTQLALGIKRSKYDEYIEKWDIIDNLIKSFEEMTHGGHS